MVGTVREGQLLWEPSRKRREAARVTAYLSWLRPWLAARPSQGDAGSPGPLAAVAPGDAGGADPSEWASSTWPELWRWSVSEPEAFWESLWHYFDVRAYTPYERALPSLAMPGTRWFPGATLNYAEHALARGGDRVAVVAAREDGRRVVFTRDQLREAVAGAAAGLRRLGVRPGDRVAAVLPNGEHALVAFLATASLGAVWSSCSPDFGVRGLVDRFAQIEPTVLLGVDGYRYGGREFPTLPVLAELRAALPGLAGTVVVPWLSDRPDVPGLGELPGALTWQDLTAAPAGEVEPLTFTPVPFDEPLWVLYSSGTTGLPKPIVQSHGGILLEHLKSLALHLDLGEDDTFFWFTTTGWMMWNFLVSGLLVGSTVVLYDGSPGYPDMGALWRLAAETGITCFGTSAPYLISCGNDGIVPREVADLSALRTVGSTGAPLPPEAFAWVYDRVAPRSGPNGEPDLLLASISGGSDVCTAFVGGLPVLPVHAGEIQTRCLGAAVAAYDDSGHSVIDQVGELVIERPMPSMPVRFWGDEDGSRLRESYFSDFPGVWRHGDWIKITSRGSVVIYGRSDSTLNRGGVRIGTAEFYRVVNELPEITDSLVVDTSGLGSEGRLLLFVTLRPGATLDDELVARVRGALRRQLSPRHVPDLVVRVDEIPVTLNGKKLEVPVKRILTGAPVERAVSLGAVANPEALEPFVRMAQA